ncbi:MAG: toprim domain-containing protein, partial [Stenotrophomonas sp.]
MPFDGFIAAARASGLVIEGAPVASGTIQRVRIEGTNAKDKPGWYVLHADEPGRAWAVFGDWRRSHEPPENWQEGGTAKPLSPAERAARERATHAADEARNKAQAAAAAKARHQWESYPMADASHGYLSAKGISPHGARLRGGLLVIPLRDAAGAMLSLQTVAPNGEKRFLPDGRTAGAFAMLGNPEGAEWLLIAEGFATAASLHEATERPVAAAMNAGNLAPVAAALAQRHPAARILVCGDDDSRTEKKTGRNPGREAAQAAARGV